MVQLCLSSVGVVIKDGKLSTNVPAKLERNDGTLSVVGRPGVSMSIGTNMIRDGNGNVFMSGGGISCSNVSFGGNAHFISGGNSGVTQICANSAQTIMINGHVIDPSVYQGTAPPEPDSDFKILDVAIEDKIDEVVITAGNAIADIHSNIDSSLRASISGNGRVNLYNALLENLTCSVTGNGRVALSNVTIKRFQASVVGNGSVTNGTISGSGSISVVGNGSVRIRAMNPKNVSKTVVGNGEVDIEQA